MDNKTKSTTTFVRGALLVVGTILLWSMITGIAFGATPEHIDLPASVSYSLTNVQPSFAPQAITATHRVDLELLDTWAGDARGVTVRGDYLYVAAADGLYVLDVVSPAIMSEVGYTSTLSAANRAILQGDYAYVVNGAGLRIVNISAPDNLQDAGFYDTAGTAQSIAISGTYAYVADGSAGIQVLDVTDPISPTHAATINAPQDARDIAISGGYAYIADGANGLRVLEIISPTTLNEVGLYDTPGTAAAVVVNGRYAYIAAQDSGLRVIDVFSPTAPSEVGFYNSPGAAGDVALAGNYAYLADGQDGGVRVVDVRDPTAPIEVGQFATPGAARGIAVTGSYLYVACAEGGTVSLHSTALNLQLSKTDAPDPVRAGHDLVYTVTITNAGETIAGVVLTETYDARVDFVAADPLPDDGNNVWTFDGIGAGAVETVLITVHVPLTVADKVMLYNTATLTASNIGPLVITETTTVQAPIVTLVKNAAHPAPLRVGDIITYTITASNEGSVSADVVITDPLPAEVVYLDDTVDGAVYDAEFNQIEYSGVVTPSAVHTITFAVRVGCVFSGTGVTNTAWLNYGQGRVYSDTTAATVFGEVRTVQNLDTAAWYCALQDGIDAASWGEVVMAYPRTYTENITLRGGVKVYGAGAGLSIIKGDGTASVVSASGSGITATTVISGFTITGGSAEQGGGIYVDADAAPTIQYNTIRGNTATKFGGGVYIEFAEELTLTNNLIIDNTAAQSGGGVYVMYSALNMMANIVRGNGTDGVYVGSEATLYGRGNLICNNTGCQLKNAGGANVDVADNWWGENDPADKVCGTAVYTPWIELSLTADPMVIPLESVTTTLGVLMSGEEYGVPKGTTATLSALNVEIAAPLLTLSTSAVAVTTVMTRVETGVTEEIVVTATEGCCGGFVTTTVRFAPDLHLIKAVNREAARPGDILTYTLNLQNRSSWVAKEIFMTDTLPAHIECADAEICGSGVVSWYGDLEAGGELTFTYPATVAIVAEGTVITNAAVVHDGNRENPSDNVVTTVVSYEPNDLCAQALPITLSTVYTGYVADAADVDFYSFFVSEPNSLVWITMTPPLSAGYEIYLYDSCGADEPVGRRPFIPLEGAANIGYNIGAVTGTYYISVSATITETTIATAPYGLMVSTSRGCMPDTYEPNDTCDWSEEVIPELEYSSFVCDAADWDFYTVHVTYPKTTLWVTMTTPNDMDNNVYLFDACQAGEPGVRVDEGEQWDYQRKLLGYNVGQAVGDYFIAVNRNITGAELLTGSYSVQTYLELLDTYEPNDLCDRAHDITAGTVYSSYISRRGDFDVYKLRVSEPGTRVRIDVRNNSNVASDLYVYKACPAQVEPIYFSEQELYRDEAVEFTVWTDTGDYFIGVRGRDAEYFSAEPYQLEVTTTPIAAGDDPHEPDSLCNQAFPLWAGAVYSAALSSGTDTDLYRLYVSVPSATITVSMRLPGENYDLYLYDYDYCAASLGAPLAAGTKVNIINETLTYTARLTPAYYLIQVKGSDANQHSAEPYRLDVAVAAPAVSDTQTLILVNPQRMAKLFPTAAVTVTEMMTKLNELADRVGGEIVVLEDDTIKDDEVVNAYEEWQTTDAYAANAAARAVKSLVAARQHSYPNLRYIVIVGDDRVIPFYRLADETAAINDTYYRESKYQSQISVTSTVGAALAQDFILTDDFYAARAAVDWQDSAPRWYIPGYAIGRLVETPADIIAAIDRFLANDAVEVDNALVVGDSVMKDAASEIAEIWQNRSSASVETVTSNYTLLRSRLLDSKYGVISLNTHTRHDLLAAVYPNWDSNIVRAGDILDSSTAQLTGTVVYNSGSHAGLNISDAGIDLAQAFVQRGAVYVGNTGYAWSMTDEPLGYSELLMRHFSEELTARDRVAVGEALLRAKQRYYLNAALIDSFDEKTLAQAVVYGLPMYEIHPHPQSLSLQGRGRIVANSGFARLEMRHSLMPLSVPAVFTFSVTSVDTDDGEYYTQDGAAQVNAGESVQPRMVVNFDQEADGELRGVVLRTGTREQDETGFDPVIATAANSEMVPSVEITNNFDSRWRPQNLFTLRALETPSGISRTLVLVGGQYYGETQTERLFDSLYFDIYYNDTSSDYDPPKMEIDLVPLTEFNAITVTAQDASGVDAVVVAYVDENGDWNSLELGDAGDDNWLGTLPVISAAQPPYLIQVVDGAGNVSAAYRRVQTKVFLPLIFKNHHYCPDDYEPDNSYQQAKSITVNGAAQEHNFHLVGDEDWIEFAVTDHTITYTIATVRLSEVTMTNMRMAPRSKSKYAALGFAPNQQPVADTVIYIYEYDEAAEDIVLLDWQDDSAVEGYDSYYEFNPYRNGTFYVKVVQYDPYASGCDAEYEISITAE